MKLWSDKAIEFKGAFKKFSESNCFDTNTANSEAKIAFADRNIRSQIHHLKTFGEQMFQSVHKRIAITQ